MEEEGEEDPHMVGGNLPLQGDYHFPVVARGYVSISAAD